MNRSHSLLVCLLSTLGLAAQACGSSAPAEPKQAAEATEDDDAGAPERSSTPSPIDAPRPSTPSPVADAGTVSASLLATPGLYTTTHIAGLGDKCDYEVAPQYASGQLTQLALTSKSFNCQGVNTAMCTTGPDGKATCRWTTPQNEQRVISDISAISFVQTYGDGTKYTYVNTAAPKTNPSGEVLTAGKYTGKTAQGQATCDLTITALYSAAGLGGVVAVRSQCQDAGTEIYACDAATKLCSQSAGAQTRTIKVLTNKTFEKTFSGGGQMSAFNYTLP